MIIEVGKYKYNTKDLTLKEIRSLVSFYQNLNFISYHRAMLLIFGWRLRLLSIFRWHSNKEIIEMLKSIPKKLGIEKDSSDEEDATSSEDGINDLYANIIRYTALSVVQVDDLTMPQLEAIRRSLYDTPPIDLLVSGFLGYKNRSSRKDDLRSNINAESNSDEDVDDQEMSWKHIIEKMKEKKNGGQ